MHILIIYYVIVCEYAYYIVLYFYRCFTTDQVLVSHSVVPLYDDLEVVCLDLNR